LTQLVKIVIVARFCVQDEFKILVQLSKKDAAQCWKWRTRYQSRSPNFQKQHTIDLFCRLSIPLQNFSIVKSYFRKLKRNLLLRLILASH